VALSPEDTRRLAGARPVHPEAYDAYLKGSFYWKVFGPENLDTAQRYFELALEKDPSYAPAYAGLAWVWAFRRTVHLVPPDEGLAKAREAALRAVELDDSSAEAHAALAVTRGIDWDWAGADREYRRALELDPKAAYAHAYFALNLVHHGRVDEAILHSERALELDPYNELFLGFHARVLCAAQRYDDALATARKGLAIQPRGATGASHAVTCFFVSKGMRDELLARKRERIAGDPELVAAFDQGLAEGGYEGAMRHVADLMAARYERSGGVEYLLSGKAIADWYVFAGDHERAMDWLDKAFEVRDPYLPHIYDDCIYGPLRSDPRFQDLLRRMNLPQAEIGS
jgi:Tfp pilus assembly protein PilF